MNNIESQAFDITAKERAEIRALKAKHYPSPASVGSEEVKEALEWFEPRARDGWHYNEKGAVLAAEVRRLSEAALCGHERPFCHDTPECSRTEAAPAGAETKGETK